MKKILFLIFCFCISQMNAQNNNLVSMQLFYNQIEIGYGDKIVKEKLWGQCSIGIANQDFNNSFNDVTCRIGLTYRAFQNQKNLVAFNTSIGIYLPNNEYYKTVVPLVYVFGQYTRYLGKSNKHGIFIQAGYRYGKKTYQQEYQSGIAIFTTNGTFRVSPVYLSFGYEFHF